jgi:hypothetical protein
VSPARVSGQSARLTLAERLAATDHAAARPALATLCDRWEQFERSRRELSSSEENGALIESLASRRAPIQRAPWTSGVSEPVLSFMRMLLVGVASGCVPVTIRSASAPQFS